MKNFKESRFESGKISTEAIIAIVTLSLIFFVYASLWVNSKYQSNIWEQQYSIKNNDSLNFGEKLSECIRIFAKGPTKEECTDMVLYDEAIDTKNIELCQKMVGPGRDECIGMIEIATKNE